MRKVDEDGLLSPIDYLEAGSERHKKALATTLSGLWKQYMDELMAQNITEAVCDQFSDWLASETPFKLKADIYYRVRESQKALKSKMEGHNA